MQKKKHILKLIKINVSSAADAEETALNAKKFVRYDEGAKKYSMGLSKFQTLAREAKAKC